MFGWLVYNTKLNVTTLVVMLLLVLVLLVVVVSLLSWWLATIMSDQAFWYF